MKHNAKHCKTNAFTGGTWQCHFSAVALIRNRLFTQARIYSPSQAVMIAQTINLLKKKNTVDFSCWYTCKCRWH